MNTSEDRIPQPRQLIPRMARAILLSQVRLLPAQARLLQAIALLAQPECATPPPLMKVQGKATRISFPTSFLILYF